MAFLFHAPMNTQNFQSVPIYKKGCPNPGTRPVTINCLGDSITYGIGSSLTPERPMENWLQYHKHWQNLYEVTVRNYGQCGSFIADYADRTRGAQPNDSIAFVRRFTDMDDNADIVTVLGGVNDCQAGYYTPAEFGTIHERENYDTSTFCGALHALCAGLRQKYPHALLVYLTPLMYGDQKDGRGAVWKNTEALPAYIDAIYAIAPLYGLLVVDLYTPKALHFCTDSDDPFICGDRLHFGCKAHAILGDYIMNRLAEAGAVKIFAK